MTNIYDLDNAPCLERPFFEVDTRVSPGRKSVGLTEGGEEHVLENNISWQRWRRQWRQLLLLQHWLKDTLVN